MLRFRVEGLRFRVAGSYRLVFFGLKGHEVGRDDGRH